MNIEKAQSNIPASAITALSSSQAPSVGASGASPPASLLPDPNPALFSGDMGAAIAALAVQQGQAEEQTETQATETQDTIQDSAEAAQVATLHNEASTMRAGAWESGLLQIAAGAATMASGGSGTAAAMMKGAAEGLSGAGTIAGGLSKAAATDLDASATASKALSDAAGRAGDVDRDAHKSAASFVQAALDFYREYAQAKSEAQAASVHGA